MKQPLYTVQVPGPKKAGETLPYRNINAPHQLMSDTPERVRTLYENFQHGLKLSANDPCFGFRPVDPKTKTAGEYVWLTYRQVNERLTNFGSGLLELRKNIWKETNVLTKWHLGLYAPNRVEWVVAEQAANAYSLVTVALYDTLGAETLEFIIQHAELGIIVCSFDKIPNLLKVSGKCPGLKVIISMDQLSTNDPTTKVIQAWAADRNILLLDVTKVEELGRQKQLAHIPPAPEDICTICYTSGTTGNPKGALIKHINFITSGYSIQFHNVITTSADCMISYLPLAHCFERIMQVSLIRVGARIGFYRGDVLLLVDDIACLKPTIFPSVPRLFNRIHDKLQAGTVKAPGLRGVLFRKAYADKLACLKAGGGIRHAVWDQVVFGKVARVLGGRVRLMVTGSAPISGDVLTFLRICFSCEILEGYGQTENAAGSTLTFPGDYRVSQVGVPLACNEIKLVDVADMGYFADASPPKGEVCIRGSNVMKGYFKDDAKTRETIDEEGWLHTGDIGTITPQGTLAIIDRKKNIFKLAQGEYVAPEKLENIYQKAGPVMQCYVHGDSLQSELVAVVVPDSERFVPWVRKNVPGVAATTESVDALCRHPDVIAAVLTELNKVGKKFKLQGFEMVKAIHLDPVPFSVDNDLLTPTFKLKRNVAVQKYRAHIDAMYRSLSDSKPEPDKSKL